MKLRIPLNLASAPFEAKRKTILLTLGLTAALGGLLLFQLELGTRASAQARQVSERLQSLQQQLAELQQKREELERRLRQPANAQVTARSVFLNELLYRRAISWTRIFEDLEGVLPHNVRVISIRPQVDSEHHVLLDMVVGAQDKTAVIEMLKRMEGSEVFGETYVHSWLPPTQVEPLYRYRITVRYAQKL